MSTERTRGERLLADVEDVMRKRGWTWHRFTVSHEPEPVVSVLAWSDKTYEAKAKAGVVRHAVRQIERAMERDGYGWKGSW